MSDQQMRVHETTMLYDTFRISRLIANAVQGVASFAAMAALDFVPFLNARNEAEAGSAYTNLQSKDKIAHPFYLESIGLRFRYPSPYLSDLTPNGNAMAKVFQEILPDHAWFEFGIREDCRLKIKPSMLPPGYGPTGSGTYIQWFNANFSDDVNMGVASLGNRFRFVGDVLAIPDGSPIWGKLYFSQYARTVLLPRMTLWDLDMFEGAEPGTDDETTANEALIECTLRGTRLVQQRGELSK
jgi:hypothetical protein